MDVLKNKTALITGGTSGMGAATAKRFLAEGATVIVTGSTAENVENAKKEMPGIEVLLSDAGNAEATKALVDQVKEKHGRLDVLFINAGIAKMGPSEEVDEAFFDSVFNTNVRGRLFPSEARHSGSRRWRFCHSDFVYRCDQGLCGPGHLQRNEGRAKFLSVDVCG